MRYWRYWRYWYWNPRRQQRVKSERIHSNLMYMNNAYGAWRISLKLSTKNTKKLHNLPVNPARWAWSFRAATIASLFAHASTQACPWFLSCQCLYFCTSKASILVPVIFVIICLQCAPSINLVLHLCVCVGVCVGVWVCACVCVCARASEHVSVSVNMCLRM